MYISVDDTDAFHVLFLRHAKPLTQYAYRYVRAPHIAEDIVQEVFLRMWEHRERRSATISVQSYLYSAVRNASLTYWRHQRIVQRLEERMPADLDAPGMSASPLLPGVRLEGEERRERVWRAVADLPNVQRLVVTLRWRHHLSHAEVARVAGISIKTVENHITRAFRTLRLVLAIDRDPSSCLAQ